MERELKILLFFEVLHVTRQERGEETPPLTTCFFFL